MSGETLGRDQQLDTDTVTQDNIENGFLSIKNKQIYIRTFN